jgi:DNA-binding NtrC family response regulator
MAEVRDLVLRFAPADGAVLIAGESGTCKELVARALHQAGPRRDRPFLVVACGDAEALLAAELLGRRTNGPAGARRDGLGALESVQDGTLVLDDVGDLPPALQLQVLQAIEDREFRPPGSPAPLRFSGRIVGATSRDLRSLVDSGRFRKDLYHRLVAAQVPVPPLRSRPEDISDVAPSFLAVIARSMNRPVPILGATAAMALEQHPWPGNLLELHGVLERAMILNDGPFLEVHDLPSVVRPVEVPASATLRTAREAFERLYVERVLRSCGGNKSEAARKLGIAITSVYRKLGLPDPPFGKTEGH